MNTADINDGFPQIDIVFPFAIPTNFTVEAEYPGQVHGEGVQLQGCGAQREAASSERLMFTQYHQSNIANGIPL